MSKHFIQPFVALLFLLPALARAGATAQPSHDLIDFGKKFADVISAGQQDAVAPLFDIDELINRIQANIEILPELKQRHRDRTSKQLVTLLSKMFLGTNRVEQNFKFIRCRLHGKEWVAVYRYLATTRAGKTADYKYIKLNVQADTAGQLHFVDYYSLISDFRLSETFRTAYLVGTVKADPKAVGQLGDKERAIIDNNDTIQTMLQDAESSDFKAALKLYTILPNLMQTDRTVQNNRIWCLIGAGKSYSDGCVPALEDYHKYYPDDPSADYAAVQYFSRQKQYSKAHDALDRLIAWYGDDGNFEFQHAFLHINSGINEDQKHAVYDLKTAIQVEPTFEKSYPLLIGLDNHNKDFTDLASTLNEWRQNTGGPLNDLTKIPAFADFVKSPEYAKWVAEQKAMSPTTLPEQ